MRSTAAARAAAFAVLAAISGFQLLGLTTALVAASRPRVTDFGLIGPGLGGHSNLQRIRALGGLPADSVWGTALAAGLERGDVVTHIDGVPMAVHPGPWYAGRFTTPPGTTLHLTVRRQDRILELPLVTTRLAEPLRWPVGPTGPHRPYMDYRVAHWLNWGPQLLMATLMFLVGLVLGLLRRDDPTAWTFALVFLGISLATSISNTTPLLHVWPPWLALFWVVCAIAGAAYSMPLGIAGLARFPTATRVSQRFWPWRWVPFVVLGIPATTAIAIRIIAHTGQATGTLSRWSEATDLALNIALALGFATMGVLLAAHRVDRAPSSRARLRVLWYGAMAAVLGGLWSALVPTDLLYRLTAPWGATGAWLALFLDDLAPALLVCLMPLSFAYAILARRLFGIRLVVRRGLQHLLLSRGVLMAEGALLFLILEQALRRGAALPGVQGPALAGAIALIVVSVLALVNRPLMQALDRRFFRDRYEARRVMLDLTQELARLSERDEIVRRVGEAVEGAFHPFRAGIFLERDGGAGLVAAWRSDPGVGAAADEVREAAALGDRLALEGNSAWLVIEPPPAPAAPAGAADGPPEPPDLDGATDPAPYELLIPLRRSRAVSGCVVLAAKRSEEPYTSEDRELLVTLATQAALALENAELLTVARREAQLAREVEIARDVQKNLFPRELPRVPGWEVAAVCRAARTVAGDYYDVMLGADGGLCVALGDVSGKGIGASLLSAGMHAVVRSRLPVPGSDLARLVEDLNAHLIESSAAEMFATLVVARIDPAQGRMVYANAGHPPPLVIGSPGPRWLDQGGPLAGVIPGARYVMGEARLEPGDLLAIYSDGVTEAERPGEGMFGDDRLLAAVKSARDLPAAAALAAVLQAVEAFTGEREPADDVSLILVRRLP